jgi:rhamnosyltransferase subunit B
MPSGDAAVRAGFQPSAVMTPGFLRRSKSAPDYRGAHTFGSMFLRSLLHNGEALRRRLAGWDAVLREFQPDVIVADYASCLAMVAWGRVPVLVIGNGYTLPPPEAKHFMPLWHEWQTDLSEEARQLEALNSFLQQAGATQLDFLPQINRANSHALLSVPIYDPYNKIRKQVYLGASLPGGAPRPGQGQSFGCFAYFSELPSPASGQMIASDLQSSELFVDAYIEGKTPADFGLADASRVTMHQKLQVLAESLPGRAVIVHRGSLGVAIAALYAGVPQIALYVNDENWVIGNAVLQEGIGLSVQLSSLVPGQLATMMRAVANDQAMRVRALRFADIYAHFAAFDPAQKVANMAVDLLR